jgi:hypothetical protein
LNRRIAVLQTAPLTTWVCRPLIAKRLIAVSSVKAKPLFSTLCRFKPLGEEQDGAGDGGRTRDFNLGKVALYH